MTNAIFMNGLFMFSKNQSTAKEAKVFIDVAKKTINQAETEIECGLRAGASLYQENNHSLAPIALWHYEKGLKNFRDAIACLEKAKTFALSARHKRYVESKIDQCFANAYKFYLEKQKIKNFIKTSDCSLIVET